MMACLHDSCGLDGCFPQNSNRQTLWAGGPADALLRQSCSIVSGNQRANRPCAFHVSDYATMWRGWVRNVDWNDPQTLVERNTDIAGKPATAPKKLVRYAIEQGLDGLLQPFADNLRRAGEVVREHTPSGLELIREEKKGDGGYAHHQREYDFHQSCASRLPQFSSGDIFVRGRIESTSRLHADKVEWKGPESGRCPRGPVCHSGCGSLSSFFLVSPKYLSRHFRARS
jgi:hypothetical protein